MPPNILAIESMLSRIRHTGIRDVKVIDPRVDSDSRGLLFESFDQDWFEEHVARGYTFVQDRHMMFTRNALVGLHYQIRQPQGVLLRVASGETFAVALDLRRWSVTFGRWVGEDISAVNSWQMWIPPGFAYGFVVRSAHAEILVRTTTKRNRSFERTVCWNDPELDIAWGLEANPLLSTASANCVAFGTVEAY